MALEADRERHAKLMQKLQEGAAAQAAAVADLQAKLRAAREAADARDQIAPEKVPAVSSASRLQNYHPDGYWGSMITLRCTDISRLQADHSATSVLCCASGPQVWTTNIVSTVLAGGGAREAHRGGGGR